MLAAAIEQQLHAQADTHQRPPGACELDNRLVHAIGSQVAHGISKGTHTR